MTCDSSFAPLQNHLFFAAIAAISLAPGIGANTGMNSLPYPIYKDFREQNQVFSGMAVRKLFILVHGQREVALVDSDMTSINGV